MSPVTAALEQARQHVRNGDSNAAVSVLTGLAQGGFTAVNAIALDAELNLLAGVPEYDALITSMTAQAYPCEHDVKFREFDFWLGEWDVHLAGGALAGHNLVTSEQRGCFLQEEWTSVTGGTGSSINYLDERNGEWVQIWNDTGGNQINIRGGLNDGSMVLKGSIHYVVNDTTLPFRAQWTPLEDGRVRQFFEQSNDGGETWVTWFEGFYTRKAVAAE
ncbi:MAG: hypothetical protein HKN77_07575 [Woeseiaceae bacterium]|nr:hypothetical protein [Woeseiaceae bacterium]